MVTTRRERRRSLRIRGVSTVLACCLVVVACSDDDPSVVEDQAAQPDGDAAVPDEFAEGIPLYPGSEPAGSLSSEGSTTTRSYTVETDSAERVLSHFANMLEDWEQRDTEDVGDALRTEFVRDDGTVLEVSATAVGDEGTSQTVQYSLVLTE